MAADKPEEGVIELRVLWRGLDDSPILFTNQFLIQTEQDDIILTLGQLQPPVLLGELEDRIAQAQQLGYIPINAVARFGLSRKSLGQLADALQEHIQKYDSTRRG